MRRHTGSQRTYDLTVDSVHTYYVVAGDTPVLVHNCGGYFDGHAESCVCEGGRNVTWEGTEAAGLSDEEMGLTKHAVQRIQLRGVSVEQARLALGKEPFSYFHEGMWKSGYYDPSSKVFIAKTVDGNINTIMNNVDKSYIRRLQGGR